MIPLREKTGDWTSISSSSTVEIAVDVHLEDSSVDRLCDSYEYSSSV